MKKAISLFGLLLLLNINIYSQVLIESEHLGTYGSFDVTLILSQIGSPEEFNIDYDVNLYKIVYNTIDPKGNATIASGALAVPIGYDCAMPIASYNHGTVVLKDAVPSNESTEALIGVGMASSGYIVSLPDYLGLGDSPGFHPYVHAKSQATATIDMIYASKEFLDSQGHAYNDQLFLFGYSQGGHACMATHKEIEENPSYGLTVTASAPMSGPYDISGIQTQYLVDDIAYDSPGYLPYVVLAYQQIYDYLPQTPAEIFVPPYDTLLLELFDGTNSFGEINSQVPAIPNQMIIPEVFQAFKDDPDHPLRLALRDNDVYDWSPTAPIHMFYCTEDEQVNFENALLALDVLTENGADVQVTDGGPLTHGGCVSPALIGGKSFFDSYREEGLAQGIEPNYDLNQIAFSSDPGSGAVTFEWWLDGEPIDFNGPELDVDLFGYGEYTILVTATETGCNETFVVNATPPAGIDGHNALVQLYPNPTKDNVALNSAEFLVGQTLQVFASNGELLFSDRIVASNQLLSLSDLPSGIYLLKVGNRYQEKIIKH